MAKLLRINKTYYCDHCETHIGPIKPRRCIVCGLLFTNIEIVKIKKRYAYE